MKGWSDLQLKIQFQTIYWIGLVLPLLLLSGLFFFRMVSDIQRTQQTAYRQAFDNIERELADKISRVVEKMHYLYQNEDLYRFLETDYNDPADFVTAYNSFLDENPLLFTPGMEILTITVATDNPTLYNCAHIEGIQESTPWLAWIRRVEPRMGIFYHNSAPESLFVLRNLDFFTTCQRYMKVVKIELSLESINRILENNALCGSFALLDSGSRVIAGTLPEETDRLEIRDLGRSVLVENWKIGGSFEAHGRWGLLVRNYSGIILSALLLPLFTGGLLYLFSRSIYRRILGLAEVMSQVDESSDLSGLAEVESPVNLDEIGILYRSFNCMVRRLHALVEENIRVRLAEKESALSREKLKYRALLSQINPHYLFNVFESIRMQSLVKGERETAGIIRKVSSSYRRLVSWKKDLIPVSEEVGTVTDFLDIQQYRFGADFQYRLEIDPEILMEAVPKYLLQPFVENACFHGVENSSRPGRIHVRGRRVGRFLFFVITDNGAGFGDPEALMKKLEGVEVDTDRIGLSNLYQRLRFYYTDCFLYLENLPEGGARVLLTLGGPPRALS